jgi:glycosyltransferase involved in cell wall biosynthesis
LVSIVLPTYNGQRYLREAVESCRGQTYDNWELIVVDDASTDATPEIVAGFVAADGRIRSIRHKQNRKLPAGLNTGFAASRGAYLTWTSDDNLYEPDALERMVDSLESNPDVGLVYCDLKRIGADGQDVGRWELPGPEAFPHRGWIGACFLYRREVYQRVGQYDPGMFLAEDFEYWLRVVRHFEVLHLAGFAPYRYRHHDGSLTALKRAKAKLQRTRALGRHALVGAERRRRLARAFCRTAWYARGEGDYWGAMRYYLGSFAEAGINLEAATGLLKLLPHYVLTGIRNLPAQNGAHAES